MPATGEVPNIDDVFVDASLRSHASSAIREFQQHGLLATFQFETTQIQRMLSPLTGCWEFTVGHKHAPPLPIVQAGLSVLPTTLHESPFIRLTQVVRTNERTSMLLMLQILHETRSPELPIVAIAAELTDPETQSQKTIGLTYTTRTREKVLMYRTVSQGKPLFEPSKLYATVPTLFNENELPPWGFSQSALAVFDEEKAYRMIQQWQKSLDANMMQSTPEEALSQINMRMISA